MRMLVSVRDEGEALAAAGAGADFIDLKEPREGALGGLAPERIASVMQALRRLHPDLPVSATIGDFAVGEASRISVRVRAVGACGVDYVKVGIGTGDGEAVRALLHGLATVPYPVVPVFIADAGLDFAAVEQACELPFPAVMADTQNKLAGSLFDCVGTDVLSCFVATVRGAQKLVGLAGALRAHHVGRIARLSPDFAGFRSAVCQGARVGALDPERVRDLRRALREAAETAVA